MKKNNMWNRLFHSKEVKANTQRYKTCTQLCMESPALLNQIEQAQTLDRLIELHKRAFKLGFQRNLGPGAMFRCESIENMTNHQVFLGGIYGLNTFAAAYWEQYVDEPYGVNGFGIREDYPLYKMILNQYKNHLIANIKFIANTSASEISVLAYNKYNQ